MNWQPIETAPKDRQIVLYIPGHGPSVGQWNYTAHNKKPHPYWSSVAERLFGVQWMRDRQPTHWCEIVDPNDAKGAA